MTAETPHRCLEMYCLERSRFGHRVRRGYYREGKMVLLGVRVAGCLDHLL